MAGPYPETPPHVVYQRLAELTAKYNSSAGLNPSEKSEFQRCLTWNVEYCWHHALNANVNQAAFLLQDTQWQEQLKKAGEQEC